MNFSPFPTLKTERLTLRQLNVTDSEMVLYLRSDQTINQFIERPLHRQTKTLEDAKQHIEKLTQQIQNNTSIFWGISLLNSATIIGTICLWNFSKNLKTAEVGYDLSLDFQNKGYMSEALKRVISYAFKDLDFETIEAYTHYKNESSKALLLKNGFLHLKDKKDDDNKNNSIYSLKRT